MQSWDFINQDPFTKAPPRAGTSTVDPLATPPAPVTPLQNVGLTAGYTPDYKNLILGDPSYLSWKNSANLDVSKAAAQRKAALSALAMQYGGVGTGFQDTFGDLSPDTLAMAKANQYSDTARLQRNYDQGVIGVKRSLAARGGLQSGELGYGLDQQNMANATGQYDLAQQFGNTAQQAINNYLNTESASRQAEADALRASEANVYANPMNRPTDATSAHLVPDWQTRYGSPVYTGPDGRLYKLDANGNPIEFVPPVEAPAATTTPPPAPVIPGLVGPTTDFRYTPPRSTSHLAAAAAGNALNNMIVNRVTQPNATDARVQAAIRALSARGHQLV